MRSLALGVAAGLLAAGARAQTLESRFGQASQAAFVARAALLSSKKEKEELPAPPPLVQRNLKGYGDDVSLFNNGWKEAMKALQEKDCRKFFLDHGADYSQVLKTLLNTSYSFYKFPKGWGVGAQTNGPASVFINSDGVFVTASDGGVTLNRRHYNLEEPSRVRAMILLHELGHQLGIFGADAGPDLEQVNAEHSLDIIRNCLPGNGDAVPKP